MLEIVTGVPHPDLEQALAQRIQQSKILEPFSPLLILVPSDFQRKRLVWHLCVSRGQSLLNVQVLTFNQLARRLVQEQAWEVPGKVPSDFVFTECIHYLLREQQSEESTLSALQEIPGAWAALWTTVKDLKDGTVDPDVALEALGQSEWARQANLKSLFFLYKRFLEQKQKFLWYDEDDLAGLALGGIATSSFLGAQAHILYYGFYDLTQVQLDVFTHIASGYPTTVYFPLLRGHTAFRFAQQFFDRHLCGLAPGPLPKDCPSATESGLRHLFGKEEVGEKKRVRSVGPECRIVEISGVEDEIAFVAKSILQQVEAQQIPFHDIGVVARTLSSYTLRLPFIFREHGIPIYTSISRSFAEEPLIQLVMQVLDLRTNNFQRESVLDVLLSPLYQGQGPEYGGVDRRGDEWEVLTSRLAIQKGLAQWERLQSHEENGNSSDEDRQKNIGLSTDQRKTLWNLASSLFHHLETFPEHGVLDVFVERAQQIVALLIKPFPGIEHPLNDGRAAGFEPKGKDQQGIFLALDQHFQELTELSALCGEVSYLDFVSMVKRMFQESKQPKNQERAGGEGVWVLNAMEARGLSFRVLFVMGLTEKVFPRHIREDAFLRDGVRRWCNESVGYKVPENLAGYDEEKLLFYLLVNSATESLTLLYQRSDQAGHQQIPSSYLEDFQRCVGSILPLVVPRKLSQKCATFTQYGTPRLTPREYRMVWLLNRQRPPRGWKERYPVGECLEQGMVSLKEQESLGDRLGPHDGVTGELPAFWTSLREKGLSPTALETYARCPFQYFLQQVLGLDPLPAPDAVYGLASVEVGTLVHEVLASFYAGLGEQKYFQQLAGLVPKTRGLLVQIAGTVFERYAGTHAVGYPLLWEIQQKALIDLLQQVVEEDLREMGKKWVPVMFEESLNGTLSVRLADRTQDVPITGRVDRIDQSTTRPVFRIIDYKYSGSASRKLSPASLRLEVVRGARLQPPFYLKLAENLVRGWPGSKSGVDPQTKVTCEAVWFYRISPDPFLKGEALTRVEFPGNAWESTLKTALEKTVNTLIVGIHQGHFFITPGPQCTWCEYKLACHRHHPLSAWRARMDHALITPHRRLRTQKDPR